uniref:Uncharacterized protein n=1 Tax=Acrobeloides nanus TaxID=290746 RepID=A0A914D419_9BILA
MEHDHSSVSQEDSSWEVVLPKEWIRLEKPVIYYVIGVSVEFVLAERADYNESCSSPDLIFITQRTCWIVDGVYRGSSYPKAIFKYQDRVEVSVIAPMRDSMSGLLIEVAKNLRVNAEEDKKFLSGSEDIQLATCEEAFDFTEDPEEGDLIEVYQAYIKQNCWDGVYYFLNQKSCMRSFEKRVPASRYQWYLILLEKKCASVFTPTPSLGLYDLALKMIKGNFLYKSIVEKRVDNPEIITELLGEDLGLIPLPEIPSHYGDLPILRHSSLDREQATTIWLLGEKQLPILFQQAPAGSGKTVTIVEHAWRIRQNPD